MHIYIQLKLCGYCCNQDLTGLINCVQCYLIVTLEDRQHCVIMHEKWWRPSRTFLLNFEYNHVNYGNKHDLLYVVCAQCPR